jgi:pyruvate dehydrogenase E2 component (dihydrolipoamide acetyltransferase)
VAVDLIMPKLGLTMEEGTIVRWLVAEGDRVEKGQTVLEVETDKVVVEVEATASGVIGPLLAEEGQSVPVTTLLARIYVPGEKIPQPVPGEEETSPSTEAELDKEPVVRITPVARRMAEQAGVVPASISELGTDKRLRAEDVQAILAKQRDERRQRRQRIFSSPRARKRARELDLDWRAVPGSGPRGRIVEKDVLRAAAQPGSTPSPGDVGWEMPTTVQRITAERMVASFGSVPHFYLSAEVRGDALLEVRLRLLPIVEQRAGVRLTITDLLVKIAGTALAEFPRANAFWDNGRIGLHRQVNVGLAVATDTGLMVPVLRQADRKLLAEIAVERAKLVEKARTGTLSMDNLSGGTFTLTNLGMFRVDMVQAILNPPQSAILAVGRFAKRPTVVDGELAVRPTAVLSLSCDHRVLDGALGAQFLGRVVELMEEPYALLV